MHSSPRTIARQRIRTLFKLANEKASTDPKLAQRYVTIARKIAMASKTRLPREYSIQICRHCKSFIVPGINSRVRIHPHREPHVTITCSECGKHTRIPLRHRKK